MAQVKVRCKFFGDNRFGYYGDKRRKPGDVFILEEEGHFSEKWMERVGDGNEPPKAEKVRQVTGDPKTRQPAARRSAHVRATDDKSAQGNDIAKSADANPAGLADQGADGGNVI